jgi:hypothetical protein
MPYRVALAASLCLGLAACQSPNPYVASSNPLPPAPASAVRGFDASAYPPAPRDYARYRSWAWAGDRLPAGNAAIDPAQVADSLSQALDQRGLRPARAGQPADLRVAAEVRSEQRLRQVRDDSYYGNGYGPGYNRFGPYDNYGPGPVVRTYLVNVTVVAITFYDGVSGQPVWQAAAETASDGSQGQRADALREAIGKALSAYPPQ